MPSKTKKWFIFLIVVVKIIHLHGSIHQKWNVGRVPPSSFEYAKINGHFTPTEAMNICEDDLQCGGFTFKGTKEHSDEVDVYFFHYVNGDEQSLREYMEYPHWTTYIVGSRNYIIIPGHYSKNAETPVDFTKG